MSAIQKIAEARQSALIVGVGPGLGASLVRLFAAEGMAVALAARSPEKLESLCAETDAAAFACDVADAKSVSALFAALDQTGFDPNIVIFNPSRRLRGPLVELDPEEVRQGLLVNCYGGFLVGQQAAKRMLVRGRGSIFFTGASASVKGYPQSAPFAMGKFGLRGLAESMARELQPRNIHVAHFVIDGSISKGTGDDRAKERGEDALLVSSAIAETYLHIHRQPRSAWTFEVALRPWVETF
jgi:NAD(P)-dependent dehydrogenase (short-subunit alcohol dehydrogenase family)